jgi:hypothetical protein
MRAMQELSADRRCGVRFALIFCRDFLRATRFSVSCCCLLVTMFFAAHAQESTTLISLETGAFLPEQVERGKAVFDVECTDCHEMEEFTGPGAYFEEQQGETLWTVFEYIWAEMPEDKPAWLEPEEYADVLAYLLSVYGFPAGDRALPTERDPLSNIELTVPSRPGS